LDPEVHKERMTKFLKSDGWADADVERIVNSAFSNDGSIDLELSKDGDRLPIIYARKGQI